VPGTGDDDSTVVVKKKPKVYKRKRRMSAEQIEEAQRNYRKEYDNYHSKPEQREKNAARLRARRLMIKNGKAARGDGKDVHHKDNNPLNNDETNLKLTDPSWNRREPRLRKEEIINIDERELSSTELKRREEIAQKIDDSEMKKKYGERWKSVKMAIATKVAKNESIFEEGDPNKEKLDRAKEKELKIARAIAQAQLEIAKAQERVQKLTAIQTKIKDSMATEETMTEKYLKSKSGSLEDTILSVWKAGANVAQADTPTTPEVEEATDAEATAPKKVDGRSKEYKETLKRIAMRKERLNKSKSTVKEEDELEEGKFRDSDVKKAIKIAYDMEGNMTGAWKKIEKIKRGLADEPTVKAALQDANEEVVHEAKKGLRYRGAPAELRARQLTNPDKETMVVKKNYVIVIDKKDEPEYLKNGWKLAEAVKGYFDVSDPKRMKKDLAKYKLKGKIKHKDVNPGWDEWEVSGKSVEDVWNWYVKSGYGDKNDFDDMDDFKDTHFESRVHHRAMMTEGSKEEYQKFFQAALKKFGAKSPAEMDDEKKKKFFDYIDKNWTKEEQQEFSEGELPPALKKAIDAKRKKKNGEKEDEDKDPVGESFGESIDELRKIVDSKAHGRVNDTKVDIHSANAMVQVFDQLSAGNKLKVEQMLKSPAGVNKFAEFAIANVKKKSLDEAAITVTFDVEDGKKFKNTLRDFGLRGKDVKGDGGVRGDSVEVKGDSKKLKKLVKDADRELSGYGILRVHDNGQLKEVAVDEIRSVKPSAVSDKEIDKFEKGGGKIKKLKPGGRLKGMEKKRKDVVKGRMAREEYILEGTWAIPDTQAKYDKVMKLMKKPIPAQGADKKYFNVIGDDEVWDDVEDILKKEGPKGDIRPAFKKFFDDPRIKKFMKDKGIKEEVFESMDIIRKIADSKEAAEIDGHKVDVYSASAMCKVFDNLSHANQQKVEQMLKSKKGINTFAEFSIANI